MTFQKTAAKETTNAGVEENILLHFSCRLKWILLSHISVVGSSKPQYCDRRSRSAIDLSIDCMLSSNACKLSCYFPYENVLNCLR